MLFLQIFVLAVSSLSPGLSLQDRARKLAVTGVRRQPTEEECIARSEILKAFNSVPYNAQSLELVLSVMPEENSKRTIHGLWSKHEVPQNYWAQDPSHTKWIAQYWDSKFDGTLLSQMSRHWPSKPSPNRNKNMIFWEHQWLKHGAVMSNYKLDATWNFKMRLTDSWTKRKEYFKATIDLYNKIKGHIPHFCAHHDKKRDCKICPYDERQFWNGINQTACQSIEATPPVPTMAPQSVNESPRHNQSRHSSPPQRHLITTFEFAQASGDAASRRRRLANNIVRAKNETCNALTKMLQADNCEATLLVQTGHHGRALSASSFALNAKLTFASKDLTEAQREANHMRNDIRNEVGRMLGTSVSITNLDSFEVTQIVADTVRVAFKGPGGAIDILQAVRHRINGCLSEPLRRIANAGNITQCEVGEVVADEGVFVLHASITFASAALLNAEFDNVKMTIEQMIAEDASLVSIDDFYAVVCDDTLADHVLFDKYRPIETQVACMDLASELHKRFSLIQGTMTDHAFLATHTRCYMIDRETFVFGPTGSRPASTFACEKIIRRKCNTKVPNVCFGRVRGMVATHWTSFKKVDSAIGEMYIDQMLRRTCKTASCNTLRDKYWCCDQHLVLTRVLSDEDKEYLRQSKVGYGYRTLDRTYKSPVFHTFRDGHHLDGNAIEHIQVFVESTSLVEMSSHQSRSEQMNIQNEFSAEQNFEVSVEAYFFQASVSQQSAVKKSRRQTDFIDSTDSAEYRVLELKKECVSLKVTSEQQGRPLFTVIFTETLQNVQSSKLESDQVRAFYAFVNAFGLHFLREAQFGGITMEYTKERTLEVERAKEEARSRCVDKSTSTSRSVSGSGVGVSAAAGGGFAQDTSQCVETDVKRNLGSRSHSVKGARTSIGPSCEEGVGDVGRVLTSIKIQPILSLIQQKWLTRSIWFRIFVHLDAKAILRFFKRWIWLEVGADTCFIMDYKQFKDQASVDARRECYEDADPSSCRLQMCRGKLVNTRRINQVCHGDACTDFCCTPVKVDEECATLNKDVDPYPCASSLVCVHIYSQKQCSKDDTAGCKCQVPFINKGANGCTVSNPCNLCEGDCDRDDDCRGSLQCFQRRRKTAQLVNGCFSSGLFDNHDFCYALVPEGASCDGDGTSLKTCADGLTCQKISGLCEATERTGCTCKKGQTFDKGSSGCTVSNPCNLCEGDCDSDGDCRGSLKCFQRNGITQMVYGCSAEGLRDNHDYCYAPVQIANMGADACTVSSPCGLCEGDCDMDSDCESSLKCYHRNGNTQLVYGCSSGGLRNDHDYCYAPVDCTDRPLGTESETCKNKCPPAGSVCQGSDGIGVCDGLSTCKKIDCTDRRLGAESETCANKCTPIGAACQGLDSRGACDGKSTCKKIQINDKGADACSVSSPCGQCEGDCDRDSHCKGSLKCYRRNGNTQLVPGCSSGGLVFDHDYCYGLGQTFDKGSSGCTASNPCYRCEGDCDGDDDCRGSLKCFQRNGITQLVHGCTAEGLRDNHDYCYEPVQIANMGANACTVSSPCGLCEGDCDRDSDCEGSLKCYHRNGNTQLVYGCSSGGLRNGQDYCYAPVDCTDRPLGTESETCKNKCPPAGSVCQGSDGIGVCDGLSTCKKIDCTDRQLGAESETCTNKCTPIGAACQGSDARGACDGKSTCKKIHINNKGPDGCTASNPCNQCEGDCDSDNDCKGSLQCYQRRGNNHVVVYDCISVRLIEDYDYCYAPVQINDKGWEGCSANNPCDLCQGDCDSDDDCRGSLKCFHRDGNTQLVYGCTGGVLVTDHDYCYAPIQINDKGWEGCSASNPCGRCEGDCDVDDDCHGFLKCYQRDGNSQLVPGCSGGVLVVDHDYCYAPPCATTQFACGDGSCIPDEWFCDGDNDCGDESDEADCICEDDNAGLQTEPGWEGYSCTRSRSYCDSYRNIMRKHCIKFCGFCGAFGQECWGACGAQSGPCDHFCGSGKKCCRRNWNGGENGCTADEGGKTRHECV